MSKRRFVTSEQKIAILREHLIDKVSVSDLCDKHWIRPVLFYNGQRQLFEDDSIVFERKAMTANKKRQDDARSVKIEQLEAKLQNKNEVLSSSANTMTFVCTARSDPLRREPCSKDARKRSSTNAIENSKPLVNVAPKRAPQNGCKRYYQLYYPSSNGG